MRARKLQTLTALAFSWALITSLVVAPQAGAGPSTSLITAATASATDTYRYVPGGLRYVARARQYTIGTDVGQDQDAWIKRVVRETWTLAGISGQVRLSNPTGGGGSVQLGDVIYQTTESSSIYCEGCPGGPFVETVTDWVGGFVVSVNPLRARAVTFRRVDLGNGQPPNEGTSPVDELVIDRAAPYSIGRYPMPMNRVLGSSGAWYSTGAPAGTAVAVVGDWNGDRVDEVGTSVNSGFLIGGGRSTWGYGLVQGDVPVTGDWNGDGRDDVGVYRGTQFLLGVRSANGAVTRYRTLTWGRGTELNGDIPIAGDWNGDDVDDIGVVRGNQFLLALNTSTGAKAYRTVTFGKGRSDGDLPVIGDWNGDGVADPGVVRPSGNAKLYVMGVIAADGKVHTYRVATFDVGVVNAQPLAGDWNGDGKDEPGLTTTGATVFLSSLPRTGTTAVLYRRIQLTASYATDSQLCSGTACASS